MASQITTNKKVVLFIHTEGETSKMSTECWHLLHSRLCTESMHSYLHYLVEVYSYTGIYLYVTSFLNKLMGIHT